MPNAENHNRGAKGIPGESEPAAAGITGAYRLGRLEATGTV